MFQPNIYCLLRLFIADVINLFYHVFQMFLEKTSLAWPDQIKMEMAMRD